MPKTKSLKNNFEARIKKLNLDIPTPNSPIANYVIAVQTGNLLFTAGQISMKADGFIYEGRVDTNPKLAKEAARQCALNLIGNMRKELGSLDRVVRIVKLTGFMNVSPTYHAIAPIMDGASDLFVEVFGEAGRHARSTIGCSVLPRNAMVEVEAIVEIR